MKTRLFAANTNDAQTLIKVERRAKFRSLLAETLLPYFFFVVFLPIVIFYTSFCCCLSKGENDTARSQALNILESTHIYFAQQNRYPRALYELADPPRGKPVMERVPQDPWGNEYRYRSRSGKSQRDLRVVSAGPDGIFRTDDDVVAITKMHEARSKDHQPSSPLGACR